MFKDIEREAHTLVDIGLRAFLGLILLKISVNSWSYFAATPRCVWEEN